MCSHKVPATTGWAPGPPLKSAGRRRRRQPCRDRRPSCRISVPPGTRQALDVPALQQPDDSPDRAREPRRLARAGRPEQPLRHSAARPSVPRRSRSRGKGAAIQAGSNRPLTFSGRPTFTIPPGAIAHSDPSISRVPDMTDLAIDLYLPGDTNTPAAAHDAHRRLPDQLRVRHRQPRRRRVVPDRGDDAELVRAAPRRGHRAALDAGAGRLRRLDHRRHALDARHQQPLARSPRAPRARVGRAASASRS